MTLLTIYISKSLLMFKITRYCSQVCICIKHYIHKNETENQEKLNRLEITEQSPIR